MRGVIVESMWWIVCRMLVLMRMKGRRKISAEKLGSGVEVKSFNLPFNACYAGSSLICYVFVRILVYSLCPEVTAKITISEAKVDGRVNSVQPRLFPGSLLFLFLHRHDFAPCSIPGRVIVSFALQSYFLLRIGLFWKCSASPFTVVFC